MLYFDFVAPGLDFVAAGLDVAAADLENRPARAILHYFKST
jgi:hypothetical protein